MILLVISTLATLLGTVSVILSLGLRRSVDVVTGWIALFAAQICGLVMFVGAALHALRPVPLAVAACVLAVAELLPPIVFRGRRDAARESLRRIVRWNLQAVRKSIHHPFLLVLLLVGAAVYAWRLFIVLRLPIYDWDGLWYHLTAIDTWVQSGAIVHTPQVLWADVYPLDGEAITAWSVTFLHNVHLAGLTSFLFTMLGAASVTGIARGAGVRPAFAAMAGLVFLTLPIIVIQSGMMYVDIMANTTMLAAFQFLLSAGDLPRRPRIPAREARRQLIYCFSLAGVAFGLAVGSKSTNLLSTALGCVVAVGVLVIVRHRMQRAEGVAAAGGRMGGALVADAPAASGVPVAAAAGVGGTGLSLTAGGVATSTGTDETADPAGPLGTGGGGRWRLTAWTREAWDRVTWEEIRGTLRFGWFPILCLLVPVVALSLFWYVRTWIQYGNPVYPVSILGLPGIGSIQQVVVGSQVPAALGDYNKFIQTLMSWGWDVRPQHWQYDQRLGGFGPQWPVLLAPAIVVCAYAFYRKRRLYLFGLIVPFAIMFAANPAPWWSRFTMYLAGLGAVSLAYVLHWRGRKRVTFAVSSLLVIGAIIGLYWSNVPTVVRSATRTGNLSLSEVRSDTHLGYVKGADDILPWGEDVQYNNIPAGSTIAFTTIYEPRLVHPFIGNNLERRIVIIPGSTDLDLLIAQMKAAGADYVMINPSISVPQQQQPSIPITLQDVFEMRMLGLEMSNDPRFVPVAVGYYGDSVYHLVGS